MLLKGTKDNKHVTICCFLEKLLNITFPELSCTRRPAELVKSFSMIVFNGLNSFLLDSVCSFNKCITVIVLFEIVYICCVFYQNRDLFSLSDADHHKDRSCIKIFLHLAMPQDPAYTHLLTEL